MTINNNFYAFYYLWQSSLEVLTSIKGKHDSSFFLINETDALISQIYICQETLRVLGSFSAHHQDFSTLHSALVYVMQV